MKFPQKPVAPVKPETQVVIDIKDKVLDPILDTEEHGKISISKYIKTFSKQEQKDGTADECADEAIEESCDEEGWCGVEKDGFSVADLLALIPAGVPYDKVFLNPQAALKVWRYGFMIHGLELSFNKSLLNGGKKSKEEKLYEQQMLVYEEDLKRYNEVDLPEYEKEVKKARLAKLEQEAAELKNSIEKS